MYVRYNKLCIFMGQTPMKDVQITFRVNSELRDQFMLVAEQNHLPAAQLLRDFMRKYINYAKTPALSKMEMDKRRAAVEFAKANVGLEGFKVSEDEQEWAERFILGEMDLAQFVKGR